jgi:hypothetical protein
MDGLVGRIGIDVRSGFVKAKDDDGFSGFFGGVKLLKAGVGFEEESFQLFGRFGKNDIAVDAEPLRFGGEVGAYLETGIVAELVVDVFIVIGSEVEMLVFDGKSAERPYTGMSAGIGGGEEESAGFFKEIYDFVHVKSIRCFKGRNSCNSVSAVWP